MLRTWAAMRTRLPGPLGIPGPFAEEKWSLKWKRTSGVPQIWFTSKPPPPCWGFRMKVRRWNEIVLLFSKARRYLHKVMGVGILYGQMLDHCFPEEILKTKYCILHSFYLSPHLLFLLSLFHTHIKMFETEKSSDIYIQTENMFWAKYT